jgi:hypothetical protein
MSDTELKSLSARVNKLTVRVEAHPVFAQAFGAPFATDAPPAIESLQAMQSETRSKSTTGVSVEGLPEV